MVVESLLLLEESQYDARVHEMGRAVYTESEYIC